MCLFGQLGAPSTGTWEGALISQLPRLLASSWGALALSLAVEVLPIRKGPALGPPTSCGTSAQDYLPTWDHSPLLCPVAFTVCWYLWCLVVQVLEHLAGDVNSVGSVFRPRCLAQLSWRMLYLGRDSDTGRKSGRRGPARGALGIFLLN